MNGRFLGLLFALPLTAAIVSTALAQEDQLKCYKVKDTLKLSGLVDLDTTSISVDQDCKISKAAFYCVPSTMTNEEVVNKATGMPITPGVVAGSNPGARICYKVSCGAQAPDQLIVDRFGEHTLSKLKSSLVCTPAVGAPMTIFEVTNTQPGGNFGNRAATSAACAAAATAKSLTCHSTIALLAYSGGDDIANMPANHGVRSNAAIYAAGSGAKVADDWADLLDGTWDTCVGLFCNPPGPTPGGFTEAYFLTGANNDGSVATGDNCSDWSSTSGGWTGADMRCYGEADIGCSAGDTFNTSGGNCAGPGCCGATQGGTLCLCY